MLELSELEHDAMLEVINIGIGYAADTLSSLVNDEVKLFVPSFEFLDYQEAVKRTAELNNTQVCAVSQHVEDTTGSNFHTDTILIFAKQRALQLVQFVTGEETEPPLTINDLSEMQQEAMTEIGNIVLNACIGAISNILNTEFNISLPFYQLTSYADLLDNSRVESNSHNVILLLMINFELSTSKIPGYMVFKMDFPAFEDFKQHIMDLIDSYGILSG
jgi:chemotaxis protein CheC